MDGFNFRRWNSRPLLLVLAISIAVIFSGIRLKAQSATGSSTQPIAGELTVSSNPHYFQDARGNPVILNGSQTWNTFQDWGTEGSIQILDFDVFIKFLTAHGHNFTLLWTVEMPKFCGQPAPATTPSGFTVTPLPWKR